MKNLKSTDYKLTFFTERTDLLNELDMSKACRKYNGDAILFYYRLKISISNSIDLELSLNDLEDIVYTYSNLDRKNTLEYMFEVCKYLITETQLFLFDKKQNLFSCQSLLDDKYKKDKLSEKGKIAANKRWNIEEIKPIENAQALPTQCTSIAYALPDIEEIKPVKNAQALPTQCTSNANPMPIEKKRIEIDRIEKKRSTKNDIEQNSTEKKIIEIDRKEIDRSTKKIIEEKSTEKDSTEKGFLVEDIPIEKVNLTIDEKIKKLPIEKFNELYFQLLMYVFDEKFNLKDSWALNRKHFNCTENLTLLYNQLKCDSKIDKKLYRELLALNATVTKSVKENMYYNVV